MNIKYKKQNHLIEIILKDEPQITEGHSLGVFGYDYKIESFKIDGEDMGKENGSKYFEYKFGYNFKGGDKVFCLNLDYSLARKVSVKLGLEEKESISLMLEDDVVKKFEDELIPRAKELIEKAKEKQIEEIKESDNNVSDDSKVIVSRDYHRYGVIIDGTHYHSFLRREIEEKLNIYDDKKIFDGFDYEIGSGYSTDYKMTYKELKEVIASIDDEVKEKQMALEKEAKERAEREAKEKEEREKYHNSYEVVKKVKLVYPRGGECGTDGYYRVIVKEKATGEEFDVVLRNVFDAGCWTLIYNKDFDATLTDSEKRACKWVYDHAPFTTSIRM